MEYWTEFWIFAGILCTIGALCLIFIKRRWLKHTLGWFFIITSLPVTLLIYTIPFNLGESEITKENMLLVVKEEIEKGSVKLVKHIPYFRLSGYGLSSFSNYESCGTFCENIVSTGYTNKFFGSYYNANGKDHNNRYKITTVNELLKKESRTVPYEVYFNDSNKYDCFFVERPNKWAQQFKYTNRYYICHLKGKFVAIKGSVIYRNSNFKPFALHHPETGFQINRLNWFEIYPILNAE